ncbi:MAG: AAA family ATPase [Dehalococcoidia bacterium]|nr:AAA family ATPase [Dehalococcoidia bacterium]MDD5493769.1 AAA family ATPase [Dehalococcoidia bacterium]
MVTLLVISFQTKGKSLLCTGLGKKFIGSGKKVGYIRPVNLLDEGGKENYGEADYIREVFELGQSNEQLYPIHLQPQDLWRNLTEDEDNFSKKIIKACNNVAEGKDILLVEGCGDLQDDKVSALACYLMAEKLDARVIGLIGYSSDFKAGEVLQILEKLKQRLFGVIINQVPESKVNLVQDEITEFYRGQGITVLGILPETRALAGVSVEEIARAVGGEIISSKGKANELVENVMLGAMTPDSGRDYFGRKKNKAVIARAERADMLLAALETSTKCLVVSKEKPSTSVLVKAEDKSVPVIVVNQEIPDILAGVEKALVQARFQNPQKLKALASLLDSRLDFKAFSASLGFK